MIRKILMLIIALLALSFPIKAYAAESDDKTAEKLDEYGREISSSLDGYIDDDTQSILDEQGISVTEPASGISISGILSSLWQSFTMSLTEPLRVLGRLIAVCVFTVIISSITGEQSPGGLYECIASLVNISVLFESISISLTSINTALGDLSLFMSGYVPIFSSVLASNANISSAVGYYSVMFVLCEVISFVSSAVLLPLTGAVLALVITGTVNSTFSLDGIASSIKSAVKWILTSLMTIFTGVISLKGIAGASTDTLTARTARFAASSFIPIVGGAVSEAYSTIYGSLGIIRSGVGILGIAAVTIMVLRPMVPVCALKLILNIAAVINELFGQKRTASLISGINGVLSIALGIMTAMSMIFIISTAIILMTAMHAV